MDSAVEILNLSKSYKMGVDNSSELLAIDKISINFPKGETIGIVGENGSGKSTLLKLISRTIKPSKGSITINGSLFSILELSTGFHHDLTGRENIYLRLELEGFSKKQIKTVENKIVVFSELQDFIDVPCKYYSSGMFMRLAFSILLFIDTEILILDEVFAVGDHAFKQKCIEKIEELSKSSKTILLVSHDTSILTKLCSYFIYLKNGRILREGNSTKVLNQYLENSLNANHQEEENTSNFSLKKKKLKDYIINKNEEDSLRVEIINKKNTIFSESIKVSCFTDQGIPFKSHHTIYLSCEFKTHEKYNLHPTFLLSYNYSELVITLNPMYTKNNMVKPNSKERLSYVCKIPPHFLNEGLYNLSLFFIDDEINEQAKFFNVLSFEIVYDESYRLKYLDNGETKIPVKPMFEWNKKKLDE